MVVKTNYGKEIGVLIPSKFESTYQIFTNLEDISTIGSGKKVSDILFLYWLDN